MSFIIRSGESRADRRTVTKLIEKERREADVEFRKQNARRLEHAQKVTSLQGFGLSTPTSGSDPLSLDRLNRARRKLLEETNMDNMREILPLLFNLNGKPYAIDDHFPFESFYRTRLCRNMVWKTGRQVSKSTNQAAQGVLLSNLIPYFNTLFVTPQFELIRRFSTNYVQPFIMESPVKGYFLDSTCSNNVLQRTFRNRSIMYFSFALLDCDRTRGLNCSKVSYDESICTGTRVLTPGGLVEIQNLEVGDKVLSSDTHGKLIEKTVLDSKPHSTQLCYRITFHSGHSITITGNHPFPTTDGVKRVEQIVEDLRRAAATDAARGDAGGRVSVATSEVSSLSIQPRVAPARIQLPESYPPIRVRSHTTKKSTESRLRRLVELLLGTLQPGLLPYRFFVHARGEETGHAGMAESIDANRNRVVVHGRRRPDTVEPGNIPHTRLQQEGGTEADIETVPGKETDLSITDIASIEVAGVLPTWDIEVEDTHRFVAEGVVTTNCQDLDPSFIPIIAEVMSASKWGLSQYTGTPKTLDGTLEQLWQDSSQAEWVIPCKSCKRVNVPSIGWDLDAMMGPTTLKRQVSEREPGVVCAKCGKPINPRDGWWDHLNPGVRFDFSGYHVPQLLMPMHYADPEKWAILQGKRMGFGRTSTNVFYNEVCGESYDLGAKLLTVTDLKRAAVLHENTIEAATAVMGNYVQRMLCVDWGGGGEDEISFTVAAVLGWKSDGTIDVIYGWRSLTPNDPVLEAVTMLRLMRDFRCSHLVHDFGGGGALRETIIAQAGLPESRLIPVAYQRVTAGPMIIHKPLNLSTGKRNHHLLDKTRSLQYTAELIKSRHVKFFQYDYKGPDNSGLLHDFLSLIEDRLDSRMGQELSTIIRNKQAGPDDFAHAVNMGVIAMCHANDYWPDVAALNALRVDASVLSKLSPVSDVNWDDWP